MKIRKLVASFGSLQKQELVLNDGLNVFCLPNEAGKSTWSAFLLAMFYGIDTAERATKTNLPAKTRYKPWWGGQMEGYMELDWSGRKIAIERTSTARTPMGQFRAWDLDSGEPVPELTADNCGTVLLGVERSVFVRSAFLGQHGLSVTADAALEKRLSMLVTSGDESVSAAETQKRLKDARNRIQHNRTGLLPQAEAELQALDRTLGQIHALHEAGFDARAQQQTLLQQQEALSAELDAARQAEAARRYEKRREAEKICRARQEAAQQAECEAQKYPAPEQLETLRQELSQLEQAQKLLPPEPDGTLPGAPEKPACPKVFRGLDNEAVMAKAAQDAKDYDTLTQGTEYAVVWQFAFAAVWIIATLLALTWVSRPVLAAICVVCALVCIARGVWCIRKNQARAAHVQQAARIRAQYEDLPGDQFVRFAASYHEALLLYNQAARAYEEECRRVQAGQVDFAEKQRALAQARGNLLGRISAFDTGVTDEASAARALEKAQEAWKRADAARREQQHAQAALEAIAAAIGDLPEPEENQAPPLSPSRDAAAIQLALTQTQQKLAAVQSQLDQSRGRADALGDPVALAAQREALCARMEKLRAQDAALALASQTLDEAGQELQTRFAPKLTALAGTIFAHLTGARYDRVTLDRQMNLAAGQTGEVALRQAMALSGGTADQLYLALRLAICELALPEGTPLVLDDALAMFDDTRAALALETLQALSQKRQILLFSCHSREQRLISVT